jgi:hypothetical protein
MGEWVNGEWRMANANGEWGGWRGLAAEGFEAAGDGAVGCVAESFFALLFVDSVVAFAPDD